MSPLFLIPLFYLAAVLQTWLTARIGGAVPDLVALVAICWLTTSAGRRGGLVMALAGVVCELNSNGPFGIAVAVFFVVGQAMIWLRGRVSLDGFFGQCCLAWIGATSIPIALAVSARFAGATAIAWRILVQQSVLVGLYTFVLAIPVLLLVNLSGNQRASKALLIEG